MNKFKFLISLLIFLCYSTASAMLGAEKHIDIEEAKEDLIFTDALNRAL